MVGLYLIISSYDLDDSMIDLDELLRITGAIILVDVSVLELFKPDNLPERVSLSTETAPPGGVTSLTGERRGGVDDLALRHLRSSMILWRSSRSWSHSRR
jgi:hypothetical protein